MSYNKINASVPCYQCTKRHSGCHSSCADYKAFQDKESAKAEVIREARLKDIMTNDVHFATVQKMSRKKLKANAWRG